MNPGAHLACGNWSPWPWGSWSSPGIASVIHHLGIVRDLTVGTLRCVAQLLLLGYALKYIFALNWSWVVVGVFLFMLISAGFIVRGRVKETARAATPCPCS